jgi:Permuted papain-like amidase enzyme, YaeF/YiiX, C92 family
MRTTANDSQNDSVSLALSEDALPGDEPLRAQAATLREIIPGFDRLEAMFARGLAQIRPAQRGYFTPDEDDQVRQLLLIYRNYRIAIWDIIWQHKDYYKRTVSRDVLKGFLLAYAGALVLFGKSLRVIDVVEYEPMLRAKLNEPDRKWGIESNFFEGVLLSYSSITNYLRLLAAGRYFRLKRRQLRDLGLEDDPDCGWLFAVIERERGALRGKFRSILWRRVKHDWRSAWRLLMRPMGIVRYQSQATVAGLVAGIRVGPDSLQGLRDAHLTQLRERLAPGDVLLCRADDKVTSALLPGFWAHSAIYIGGWPDLERMGLAAEPMVARYKWIFERHPSPHGYVVEAVAQGCRVHKLAYCLHADHVAVLRPRLPAPEIRDALLEAFGHVGKPYDFEFDFNVSTRIVCTELVYRAFHGRGPIRFALAKRVGRYTLTADDIAAQYLDALAGRGEVAGEPFDLIDLFLKEKWDGAERVADAVRMQRFAALLPTKDAQA